MLVSFILFFLFFLLRLNRSHLRLVLISCRPLQPSFLTTLLKAAFKDMGEKKKSLNGRHSSYGCPHVLLDIRLYSSSTSSILSKAVIMRPRNNPSLSRLYIRYIIRTSSTPLLFLLSPLPPFLCLFCCYLIDFICPSIFKSWRALVENSFTAYS